MTKHPKSKKRKQYGHLPEKEIIRLHVEGKITERQYFECIRSDAVHLSFAQTSGLDPKSLVRNARAELNLKHRRTSDIDFDELWCVFDVDQHERLAEALSDAKHSNVQIAISNPCFELWLVLHVRDQNAFISRSSIQKQSQELGLTDGKHLKPNACEDLKESTMDAKRRAIQLSESHRQTGASCTENPSSTVWRLADRLQRLAI